MLVAVAWPAMTEQAVLSIEEEVIMDIDTFDRLSRSLATRTNRRTMVKRIGGGGLFGIAVGVTGLNTARARADDATPDSASATAVATCDYTITAHISAGPSASTVIEGRLVIPIEESGAIESAQFIRADGATFDAIGQATGRALDLLVDLGDGSAFELHGTAKRDLTLCRGKILGGVYGPELGDVGMWQASRTGATGAGNGSGGGSGTGGGQGHDND